MNAPESPSVPRLPDYEFLELLGEGSFGWVYRTLWRGTQERAVKLFKAERVNTAMVHRELEKLQEVKEHPGVVTVFDFDLLSRQPYYAMSLHAEKVAGPDGSRRWQGRTLEQKIAALSASEAKRLMKEVIDPLAYLHRHDIIHCDVKASNVLLTDEGRVKLCDFGQSRRSGDDLAQLSGTLYYAAPEQLLEPGESHGGRGFRWDVYSFGVLAYRLATGQYPRLEKLKDQPLPTLRDDSLGAQDSNEQRRATMVLETLDAATGQPLQWPEGCWLEAEERKLVEQCLELDWKDRPTDMLVVKEAWEKIQTERELAVERARRRRARNLALGAGIAAVLALGAGLWAWKKQNEAEDSRQEAVTERLKTQVQLERSQLEEGRAWLERAKLAWEGKHDPLTALMLAGRAVGFHGYGRRDDESQTFQDQFQSLLGAPMNDPENEAARQTEAQTLRNFVSSVPPTGLPIWASPIQEHHRDAVTSVVFSPDGKRLASGSEDKTVKLWEVASGKELASLQGHTRGVTSVAFSPDGTRLASGSEDKTVKLWDLASGKELASLQGHSREVTSVAFSPDGTRLASGSDDKTVKLWDVATGKELASLQGHSSTVTSVAFSPDGSRLASGSSDKTVKLWDVASGKELASLQGHSDGVNSVAFSPDGSRIASGSYDNTVKLWDVASGKELASLQGHSGQVNSVAFSPDGSRIASGSHDKTVKLWDVASGKELASLQGHSEGVNSVAFSPDGTRLASGAGDSVSPGEVKLWDVASGKELASRQGHSGVVTSVAFSPDGSRLASGSDDRTVKLWDVASGKELASLQGHTRGVTSVAFSPDGTCLASGAGGYHSPGEIKLWEVASGKELASLQGHTREVTSVAFSPDGTCLASGAGGYGSPGEIKLWEVASGKELASLQGHTRGVTSVAFSPDGTRLASGSGDNTVKLWDLASGKELASLQGHSREVTSVAFSPDGSRLASGSWDNTVKLWDVASGKELPGPPDFPFSAEDRATSPDGLLRAVTDGNQISLRPASETVDLTRWLRAGYFALQGREVVWNLNDSLLTTRTFPVLHPRNDLVAQLAASVESPAHRLALRAQQATRCGAWRILPILWQEATDAGLAEDPEVRRVFALQFVIAVRRLALGRLPAFPPQLWQTVSAFTDGKAFSDGAFSLALAQALPPLLRAAQEENEFITDLTAKVVKAAPLAWLGAVASGLTTGAEEETPVVTEQRLAFLRAAAARLPALAPKAEEEQKKN